MHLFTKFFSFSFGKDIFSIKDIRVIPNSMQIRPKKENTVVSLSDAWNISKYKYILHAICRSTIF